MALYYRNTTHAAQSATFGPSAAVGLRYWNWRSIARISKIAEAPRGPGQRHRPCRINARRVDSRVPRWGHTKRVARRHHSLREHRVRVCLFPLLNCHDSPPENLYDRLTRSGIAFPDVRLRPECDRQNLPLSTVTAGFQKGDATTFTEGKR